MNLLEYSFLPILYNVTVSPSEMKSVLALFILVFIAYLYRIFHVYLGEETRHGLLTFTGLILSSILYGSGTCNLLLYCLSSYLCLMIDRKLCGKLSFAVSFIYLTSCHVFYQSKDSWKGGDLDFTGSLMILTLKSISCAANYSNFTFPGSDTLHIKSIPSFISFTSFLFFPLSLIAGPPFEFVEYDNFVSRKEQWAEIILNPLYPCCKKLLQGSGCLVILILGRQINIDTLLDVEFYNRNPLQKFILCNIVPTLSRCKYYFAWLCAEASLVQSGFGYAGNCRWNRLENVNVSKVEMAHSTRDLTKEWNKCTGKWMRRYVYEPLASNISTERVTFWPRLGTMLLSAVWHGPHPGYALFFISMSLGVELSLILHRIEKNISIIISGPMFNYFSSQRRYTIFFLKRLIFLGGNFVTISYLNFASLAFLSVSFRDSIFIWTAVNFYGYILLVCTYCVALFITYYCDKLSIR